MCYSTKNLPGRGALSQQCCIVMQVQGRPNVVPAVNGGSPSGWPPHHLYVFANNHHRRWRAMSPLSVGLDSIRMMDLEPLSHEIWRAVVLLRKRELLVFQVGHFSHLAAKCVNARARHTRRGMFHTVCPQGIKGAQLWRERHWKVVAKYRIYFDFLQIKSCQDSYKHNVALEKWRATVMSLWKDCLHGSFGINAFF